MLPRLRASDPKLLKTEYGKRWHDMSKAGGDKAHQADIELVNAIGNREEKNKESGSEMNRFPKNL